MCLKFQGRWSKSWKNQTTHSVNVALKSIQMLTLIAACGKALAYVDLAEK